MKIIDNQHTCSSCQRKNLPEPIVFAKLCRKTNKPICEKCYSDTGGGWFEPFAQAVKEMK